MVAARERSALSTEARSAATAAGEGHGIGELAAHVEARARRADVREEVCLVGSEGTAKTSNALMFCEMVKEDGSLEPYAINAVCTHLGCVVPWNKAENKFKCPCHGSQYNNEGKVIRGPAPLSLALAHANINEADVVVFSPWTETDFRTGLEPWWK